MALRTDPVRGQGRIQSSVRSLPGSGQPGGIPGAAVPAPHGLWFGRVQSAGVLAIERMARDPARRDLRAWFKARAIGSSSSFVTAGRPSDWVQPIILCYLITYTS